MSELKDLVKKDRYNFLSPYGLGDTMMLCGFKDAWEKKNKGKIHFIIKPSHEVVMKMYGITDYSVYKFSDKQIKKFRQKSITPKYGDIFIAHPIYIKSTKETILKDFNLLNFDFKVLYAKFLNVNEQDFKQYEHIPELSANLKSKLKHIAPLNKIVLFAPMANSIKLFPKVFWEKLAKDYIDDGFTVISNVTDKQDIISGSIYLPLSSEDAIALAYACHAVYSLRSGLCDLMAKRKEGLHVFYDHCNTLTLYSLNKLFNTKKIQEQIVNPSDYIKGYTPKVTIVTATYNLITNNRKDKIIQCIESVHNQTYSNTEHIIMDGGSDDGTLKLLQKYEKKGWIKIYSEKDSGIYDAMNKGIDKATGQYISFLNSDDFYHNQNAITESVKKLIETDADFSFGTVRYVNSQREHVNTFYPSEHLVMTQMPFSHQSMFCRKSVLQNNKFDTSFKLAADYDLILRLYLQNVKRVQVHAEIASYSVDGFSGNNYNSCIDEYCKVYKKNYGYKCSRAKCNKMILSGYVPHAVEKYFIKMQETKRIKIRLLFIPLIYIIKKRNKVSIKLFNIFDLISIKHGYRSDLLYLFSFIRIFKIDKTHWD